MPDVGAKCHELRIDDREMTWRIVYHIDADAIVILECSRRKAVRPRSLFSRPASSDYDDTATS